MRILLVAERFSIGVLDLAAYYEKLGHEVECAITARLDEHKGAYDVVGLSFFGFDSNGLAVSVSSIVKQLNSLHNRYPQSKLWLGGRALSLLPPTILQTLKDQSICEKVCEGDGELLLSDSFTTDDYPAWTRRHVRQMVGKDRRPNVISVQSARGCPYACTFCHRSQKLKLFAPERTVINMTLATEEAQLPMIVDDIFTLRAERMAAIRHGLDRAGVRYQKRLRFFSHVKHRNEDEIAAFDPDEVQIGLESGDDRMLALMGKKTTREENQEAVLRLNEAVRKRVVGLFLIGFPGENEESLKNTLSFVRLTKHCYKKIWVSYFIPVPNTPGMDMALKQGTIRERPVSNREIAYVDQQLTEDKLVKYHDLILAAAK